MSKLQDVKCHAIITGVFKIEGTFPDGTTFPIDLMNYGGDIEIHATLAELVPKLTTAIEHRIRGDLVRNAPRYTMALEKLAHMLPTTHRELIGVDVEEREAHTPFGSRPHKWNAATQTAYRENL